MTTPRDPNAPRNPDQLIHAFLDEGPMDLREQVLDEVRSEVDRTEQRTTFGPWRNLMATRFAGFAAVTAVVAGAVIVGLALGGGGPFIGGDPSLSPQPSPASQTAMPLPADCAELEAGTYRAVIGGVTVDVTVPAGWSGQGDAGAFSVEDNFGVGMPPCVMGGASRLEVAQVDRVYSDACTRQDVIQADTPAELVAALTAQTGHQTSGPTEATLGGYPAHRFEFSTEDGFDDLTCTGGGITGGVYAWPPPEGVGSGAAFGEAMTIWVVDIDGTPLVVVAVPEDPDRHPDGPTDDGHPQDLEPIIASLRFELAVPAAPQPSVEPSSEPSSLPADSAYELWCRDCGHPDPPVLLVTIPAPGWVADGGVLIKGETGTEPPDGAGLVTFNGDLYVYEHPCQWVGTAPAIPATTPEELVTALAAQPLREASDPVDIMIDGLSGKSITLSVPDDAVFTECDGATFGSWTVVSGQAPWRFHQGPGQIDEIYALDIEGVLTVIDIAYFAGTPDAYVEELRAIVESATFEAP